MHFEYPRVPSCFMKYLTATLVLFLLLAGCDLFTPREPEPPLNNSDPYAWRPPTSPEIVLENLSSAFPAHKLNYHLDVLSNNPEPDPTFSFFPDQGVASSQPGIFDTWGYIEEENFITKLFQALDDDGLQHLDWQVEQLSPIDDRYEIIANYQLTLSYLESRAPLPVELSGQATLTLVQNTDLLYEISTWQDLKSDTLPCWSDLKTLVQ